MLPFEGVGEKDEEEEGGSGEKVEGEAAGWLTGVSEPIEGGW